MKQTNFASLAAGVISILFFMLDFVNVGIALILASFFFALNTVFWQSPMDFENLWRRYESLFKEGDKK